MKNKNNGNECWCIRAEESVAMHTSFDFTNDNIILIKNLPPSSILVISALLCTSHFNMSVEVSKTFTLNLCDDIIGPDHGKNFLFVENLFQ